ncbi:homeodomain-interacting protein kinase 2-like isoform X2 [Sebastes umbrosus]|uniref:homeodomain-interacting protein kinase 2-like isoform X2 n=1 Tax=Sebastes umbrosus TaxID=72105 RepID=UPI00189E8021|nr:homeodomain-interacting protein kinase 2-like isoform X2 [Sebastes umbrosus]
MDTSTPSSKEKTLFSELPIPKEYDILQIVGQGGFGKVVKCVKRDTNETVAIKISHDGYNLSGEEAILSTLMRHRMDRFNIIKFHGSVYRWGRRGLVLDICDISLQDFLQKSKEFMSLEEVRSVTQQLAGAFNALKRVGVIHTDVKMNNIMIEDHRKRPLRVKLIDFGLAMYSSEASPGMFLQTPYFRSPEILLGTPFSESIDIWSLGCVMASMLIGCMVFPGRNSYDTLRFIIDLLGPPPKHLLIAGLKTKRFFRESFSRQMILKNPEQYWKSSNHSTDNRIYTFRSLEVMKAMRRENNNKTEADERRESTELLKEMFKWDGRLRITPKAILNHPFITKSYLNCSSDESQESAAAEPSKSWAQAPTDGDNDDSDESLESAGAEPSISWASTDGDNDDSDEYLEFAGAKPSTSWAQAPTNGDNDNSHQPAETPEFIRIHQYRSPIVSDNKNCCLQRFRSWTKRIICPCCYVEVED